MSLPISSYCPRKSNCGYPFLVDELFRWGTKVQFFPLMCYKSHCFLKSHPS